MLLMDLAKKMGLTSSGLSMVLSRNITLGVLNKLADALDVRVTELFERKEDIELYVKYNGEFYSLPESEIVELIKEGKLRHVKK